MRNEGDPGTIPVGAIPDPVAGCGLPDEQVMIVETNGAFDAEYSASVGTPVRRWLRTEVGADEGTAGDICSALAGHEELGGEPGGGGRSASGRTSVVEGSRVQTLDAATGPDEVEGYVLVSDQPGSGIEVDRIASVISHDLRNPLDVAKAHLQAARETGEREHFDQVEGAHDRMEQIIRDVLTLARGEDALDVADEVDVADVAADAWGTVDTGSASLTVGENLSTIQADPDRLQRLFENLFRNSIEHAKPGPAERGASSDERGDDVGDLPRLRVGNTSDGFFVADDGVGIPPEERSQVFDPGYSSSGTGLGLTIVRRIAEAHDWSVSLTTGSRGGARFEFRIPSRGEWT